MNSLHRQAFRHSVATLHLPPPYPPQLCKIVLFIGRDETLQTEHPETHIHGALVENGDSVMRERKHISPLYAPRLHGGSAYDAFVESQSMHRECAEQRDDGANITLTFQGAGDMTR